jgi:hypothetical protein
MFEPLNATSAAFFPFAVNSFDSLSKKKKKKKKTAWDVGHCPRGDWKFEGHILQRVDESRKRKSRKAKY